MATARATLRRVSSIHEDNSDAPSLSLVPDELLELEEGPAMQLSALLSAGPDSLADVRQVLHCDGAAGGKRVHQEFRYPVICVKPKPSLSSAEFLKVPFGRTSAFSLKLSLKPEKPLRMLLDMLPIEELSITGDSNTRDPDIDAYHFAGRRGNDIGQGDNQMHPEGAVGVEDQIQAIKAAKAGRSSQS